VERDADRGGGAGQEEALEGIKKEVSERSGEGEEWPGFWKTWGSVHEHRTCRGSAGDRGPRGGGGQMME